MFTSAIIRVGAAHNEVVLASAKKLEVVDLSGLDKKGRQKVIEKVKDVRWPRRYKQGRR